MGVSLEGPYHFLHARGHVRNRLLGIGMDTTDRAHILIHVQCHV